MNSITLHGRVIEDAEMTLVKTSNGETPLVTFFVIDTGLPYQRSEPMSIEVHFIKEAATHIYGYLKKNKEVVITGFLRQKKYIAPNGEEKEKKYISAEYVTLCPLYKKENKQEGYEKNDNNNSTDKIDQRRYTGFGRRIK